MKIVSLLRNKKRAISPVIAVILLIGLAVAASAAIFLIILPLLTPQTNLQIIDAYIVYDSDYTKNLDVGEGYAKGTITVSNTGTGATEIIAIRVYWGLTVDTMTTEITTNVYSFQNISNSNPLKIPPLTIDKDVSVRFPLPFENDNQTLFYRMTLGTDEGATLDTSLEEDTVSSSDMKLIKDRPEISFAGTIGAIRRTTTISPAVDDNADIKNVTFEVFYENSTPVENPPKVITDSTLWQWNWNTFNDTAEGLDNDTYYMRITVYDYAGLLDQVPKPSDPDLSLTIDNDYIPPNITSIKGASAKHGLDLAEIGNSFSVNATITDSGSAASAVGNVYLYYKLNETAGSYETPRTMTNVGGNTWQVNIPAPFVDSSAYAKNLAYYIQAVDAEPGTHVNSAVSANKTAGVLDTTSPDFKQHIFEGQTIISQGTLQGTEGTPLSLSVEVEDFDQVSLVTMVWRERNDTGISPQYGPWQTFANYTGSVNTWGFQLPTGNVTYDGLEYYFNATDPTNNIAYEGTAQSPYRISIPDVTAPTIEILSTIPQNITETVDLTVQVRIFDKDRSFSWTGSETGWVQLGYKKKGQSVFTYGNMSHLSEDSSQGNPTGIWQGTIGGNNFTVAGSPVIVEVFVTDAGGNSNLDDHTVWVSPAGDPSLVLDNQISVAGASDHTLEFQVKNFGDATATANITAIQVELTDNGKSVLAGDPYLTQIENNTDIVWQNGTNFGGANNTQLTLNSSFLLAGLQDTVLFNLTYANSSSSSGYDLNDLTVTVTLFYEYGISNSDSKKLESFDTPITQQIPQDEVRYMRSVWTTVNTRSGYEFGTSLTGSFGTNDREPTSGTYPGDLAVQWGIQIFIAHTGGTRTGITSGSMVATVSRGSGGDAEGLLGPTDGGTYSISQRPLATTDAILIEVWVKVGGNADQLQATFITEPLGATQLDTSNWEIYYYTQRDRSGPGWNRQTAAFFHWGDGPHGSRIEKFKYTTVGGGGGAKIQSSPPSSSMDPSFVVVQQNADLSQSMGGYSALSRNNLRTTVSLVKEFRDDIKYCLLTTRVC